MVNSKTLVFLYILLYYWIYTHTHKYLLLKRKRSIPHAHQLSRQLLNKHGGVYIGFLLSSCVCTQYFKLFKGKEVLCLLNAPSGHFNLTS